MSYIIDYISELILVGERPFETSPWNPAYRML